MSEKYIDTHTVINKCCEILKNTNDGNDLDPRQLKLLEMAANGYLNEVGYEKLDALHKQVTAGTYRKPFLHDIEHMTQDIEGYIYYKDVSVEHYSRPWVYTLEGKLHLLRLKDRCEFLERHGETPNWYGMAEEYDREKISQFNSLLAVHGENAGIGFSNVIVDNNAGTDICVLMPSPAMAQEVIANKVVQDFAVKMKNRGFSVTVESYHYGGTDYIPADSFLEQLNLSFEPLISRLELKCSGSISFNISMEEMVSVINEGGAI